jgi:hypothetical protein
MDRYFKVTISWSVIAGHEAQAKKNHLQSLEKLNQRGGLDLSEFLAVMQDRPWRPLTDEDIKKLED